MPPRLLPPRAVADQLSSLLSSLTPRALNTARLQARQNNPDGTVIIPASYGNLNNSPDPGAVVGIVLGSVAGFLLLLYLIYVCINFGEPVAVLGSVGTASVVTLRTRRSSHHHRHHKPAPVRLRATETVEVRTRDHRGSSGGGPRPIIVDAEPNVERVVYEERRSSTRAAPRVVHESDSEEDEVVVIEEDSTPPRRRRSSATRRSGEYRRESYREVSRRRS